MSESNYTSLYEIVILNNGKIALRRVGEKDSKPLVTVEFSEQAKFFLGSDFSDIARVMIEAGLDAVSELQQYPSKDAVTAESEEESDPVVH